MATDQSLRVLLVDDHDLFRTGMRELLEDEGFEVADSSSGAAALRRVSSLGPDVVVMDMNMPGMTGVQATQELRKVAPDTPVLMLTVAQDDERVVEAVLAGACGYLLKDAELEDIIDGIRHAAAGECVVAPRVAGGLLERIRAGNRTSSPNNELSSAAGDVSPEPLTAREREVLAFLAQGMENGEISRKLFISPSTVKSQISSIFEKLGVENRVQAAVYAIRHGLTQ